MIQAIDLSNFYVISTEHNQVVTLMWVVIIQELIFIFWNPFSGSRLTKVQIMMRSLKENAQSKQLVLWWDLNRQTTDWQEYFFCSQVADHLSAEFNSLSLGFVGVYKKQFLARKF